jgi:hypothetical protein
VLVRVQGEVSSALSVYVTCVTACSVRLVELKVSVQGVLGHL